MKLYVWNTQDKFGCSSRCHPSIEGCLRFWFLYVYEVFHIFWESSNLYHFCFQQSSFYFWRNKKKSIWNCVSWWISQHSFLMFRTWKQFESLSIIFSSYQGLRLLFISKVCLQTFSELILSSFFRRVSLEKIISWQSFSSVQLWFKLSDFSILCLCRR